MMGDVFFGIVTAISLAVQVYAWRVIICETREMEKMDVAFDNKILALDGWYERKMTELVILEAERQTREWIEQLHDDGILSDREFVAIWRRLGE